MFQTNRRSSLHRTKAPPYQPSRQVPLKAAELETGAADKPIRRKKEGTENEDVAGIDARDRAFDPPGRPKDGTKERGRFAGGGPITRIRRN